MGTAGSRAEGRREDTSAGAGDSRGEGTGVGTGESRGEGWAEDTGIGTGEGRFRGIGVGADESWGEGRGEDTSAGAGDSRGEDTGVGTTGSRAEGRREDTSAGASDSRGEDRSAVRARAWVLGVRHHGPGSARAVRDELTRIRPDLVLVEGPPEADGLVALAADPGMRPPVALLAYMPGQPSRAAFWPFAEFSPEWQAILYATGAGAEVRFCDLPAGCGLALDADPVRRDPIGELARAAGYDDPERWWEDLVEHRGEAGTLDVVAEAMRAVRDGHVAEGTEARREAYMRRTLRKAAREGFTRIAVVCGAWHLPALTLPELTPPHSALPDSALPSSAVPGSAVPGSAVPGSDLPKSDLPGSGLSESTPLGPPPGPAVPGSALPGSTPPGSTPPGSAPLGLPSGPAPSGQGLPGRRAGGSAPPAATDGPGSPPSAAEDERLLRGLPRVRVEMTWVPWTHGRLAAGAGYGAGVAAPGWYEHLFTAPDRPVERWLARAAAILREEDLPVSSAHVIEAVRLAEGLAALRGRPLAGLSEVTEAVRAVLCGGDELPVELVQRRMVVGERLGRVPDSTPMVPLRRDLRDEQRRLRMKPEALTGEHDLDLRKPLDLGRSRLLHRLTLLDVPWGTPRRARGKGTFKETWSLEWRPELDVALVEAAVWGITVEAAATARVRDLAGGAGLPELAALVERCLPAHLPGALPHVLGMIEDRAAVDGEVRHLMGALPALVRTRRYGDVRGTEGLAGVTESMLARICAGLSPALSGLDEDAAREMATLVDGVHAAAGLMGEGRWLTTLSGIARRDDLPGLLDGRIVRILFDAGALEDDVAARMARSMSSGNPPARSAAWMEGFLSGGGLLLVHDARLLATVDAWLTGLSPEEFVDVLPLLRRTFGAFPTPERRLIGRRVRSGSAPGSVPGGDGADYDDGLAAAAVRTVREILGHGISGQEIPGHEIPGHEIPGHEIPGHEIPGHEIPRREVSGREGTGGEVPGRGVPGPDSAGRRVLRREEPECEEPGREEPGREWDGGA
ncbi:hypothetical protein GCM10023074_36490 [Microbispora amethystogenes]|uniref:Uncharacterized protein n=1 Tax=Microbispora amethystogenes TaxID=1427754 RepID=A0ABQ4FBV9_9ACTN|nr:hypothetical protein Mam01_24690 [Microbispora amethystogenes]